MAGFVVIEAVPFSGAVLGSVNCGQARGERVPSIVPIWVCKVFGGRNLLEPVGGIA